MLVCVSVQLVLTIINITDIHVTLLELIPNSSDCLVVWHFIDLKLNEKNALKERIKKCL